jgi:hypothetical protein
MTTLTQSCRTPNRCRAQAHVCDPEPGSDAWLADALGDSDMKLTPTADDLAEDLAWLVGLIYLFFDDRRHEATTQAVIEDARRQLIAAIGGAA